MSKGSRRRIEVTPLRWADIDFPPWTWGLLLSREFMECIAEGERLPPGYGVAWYDYDRDCAVCMVVPLNVIAGGMRAAYRWLRFPPWRRSINFKREYIRGWNDAMREELRRL